MINRYSGIGFFLEEDQADGQWVSYADHLEAIREMQIPEGWKLVPIEPTELMLLSGVVLLSAYPEGKGTWLPIPEVKECWANMLAKAPNPGNK